MPRPGEENDRGALMLLPGDENERGARLGPENERGELMLRLGPENERGALGAGLEKERGALPEPPSPPSKRLGAAELGELYEPLGAEKRPPGEPARYAVLGEAKREPGLLNGRVVGAVVVG